MLNRLLSLGLLNADFSCVESLRHPLAIEMIAAPEGGKAAEAVRRIFPAAPTSLRIIIRIPHNRIPARASDCDWRSTKTTATPSASRSPNMTKPTAAALGPHILEDLFADTILDVSWLASRDLDIQFRLFWVKLERLLSTGQAAADMPAILAHYRDREDTPGYAEFKWALLRVDILAGKLVAAKAEDPLNAGGVAGNRAVQPHLLLGSVDFLEGRNDEALAEYRHALKLYKKEIGKRKVFFEGSNGLFFLLALIRANDSALHAEIQTHLDAIDHDGNPFSAGFQAVLALLFLLRGAEPKARACWMTCGKSPCMNRCPRPASRWWSSSIDPALAKARIKDTEARFAALARTLPLVARVHAEILAKISEPARALRRLFARRAGWRPVDRVHRAHQVAAAVGAGFRKPRQFPGRRRDRSGRGAPAAQKSRRLVWFVDPESKLIEAVEQSAKGANGWTSGRNVAMKRLHEQDPRLDYLSDHDRRALRTIRKTSVGWYGQENYDFDPYATLAGAGRPSAGV